MKLNRHTDNAEDAVLVDAPQTDDDLQDEVRRRAYQLFEQRGGRHGRDMEDWLRAEAEIAQKKPA